MTSIKKIVGLGQCSLDYIASVDEYPEEDSKPEVLEWTEQGGGPVATALVALTRLGMKTVFLGRVSDDHAGAQIKKGLDCEGVDTGGLIVKPGGRSQTAFIIANRKNSKRTVFWQRPTVGPLTPAEVDGGPIKSSGFLLLDGLMVDASVHAARIAKNAGIPVMLDGGRVREGTKELLRLSDYIVCSEAFSVDLSGGVEKAIEELCTLKPRAATITLGKRGSLTWSEGEIFRQKAFKVRAVDTTGAGDVFHAGYIFGVISGWDIKKTVEFASAFAALKCTRPGGRTGIATLNETLKLIENKR
jgi:ribokinase